MFGIKFNEENGLLILSLSDVHLFHKRVPNADIIHALREAMYTTGDKGRKPDIFIIAGDLFDRPTVISHRDILEVETWIEELVSYCSENNITLLCLEGTPSHDDRQMSIIGRIITRAGIDLDYHYYDTLCIDYLERFDKYFLFIPDEWRHDPDDIWDDVQKELRKWGLDQVHFAVMHGAFRYQLPPVVASGCHIEERYLGIVSQYIFIGHIHTKSRYKWILSHGSTVPLEAGTGDEHGFWMALCFGHQKRERDKITFKVIPPRVIFRDYAVMDMSDEDFETLLKELQLMNKLCYLRFLIGGSDERFARLESLSKQLDGPVFDYKKINIEAKATKTLAESITFKPLPLTKRDIPDLILDRLKDQSDANRERALSILKRVEEHS